LASSWGKYRLDDAFIAPLDLSGFGVVAAKHYPALGWEWISSAVAAFFRRSYTFNRLYVHPATWMTAPDEPWKSKWAMGVDVADSDRMSQSAIERTRGFDLLVVPSKWAKHSWERSGYKGRIEVLHHGFPSEWLTHPNLPVAQIDQLLPRPRILFFCVHSPFRKGLDLFERILTRVSAEGYAFSTIVKGIQPERIKAFAVKGMVGWSQIRALYDTADILLMPSRGGSFELNGLEALARGLVVIAAEGGAWCEYMEGYGVLIRSVANPVVLPTSEFHKGRGVEMDVEEAVDKLCDVFNNLDEYKARVAEFPRGEWTWDATRLRLKKLVEDYSGERVR